MTTFLKDFNPMSHKSKTKKSPFLPDCQDRMIIESESRVSVFVHIRPKSDFLLSLERVRSKVLFLFLHSFATGYAKKSKQIIKKKDLDRCSTCILPFTFAGFLLFTAIMRLSFLFFSPQSHAPLFALFMFHSLRCDCRGC